MINLSSAELIACKCLDCVGDKGSLSVSRLFNLYGNQLINELSISYFICNVDGIWINSITNADGIVLRDNSDV